jgi:glycosyltransferase involved in cell wall biosynthesis
MKIVQMMAGADQGGAELFFERLNMALARQGQVQNVSIIRENPKRATILQDSGSEVVQLPFGGPLDFKTKREVKRVLQAQQPDVVLTWMNRATKFCPRKQDVAGRYIHVARLGGYYDLKYYRHCDYLVGNTPDIVDYLIAQGWPQEKTRYLPNFVNADIQEPVARRDYYTPDTTPLLFAMGRLHENKAFDTLIAAMAMMPDVYLWLAGDGPDKEKLMAQAHNAGLKPRIRFLGWREDIAALLAAADVFVCPSRHEPLGNVVLEAWARKKPVVATASQGPSMLIEHGKTGYLSPVDDARLLAQTIKDALRAPDQLAAVADAGYQAYHDGFTEEKVISRYLAFLKDITGQDTADDGMHAAVAASDTATSDAATSDDTAQDVQAPVA